MATNLLDNGSGDVVELSATDGVAFIEQASPLTRLHYFDGQFLRASSLTTEQDYHRHAVQRANLAGGWGVVHGFGISLAGNQLALGGGLAVTPTGSFVLAGMDMKATLADLLGSAKPAPVAGAPAFGDCLEAKPTMQATTGLQVYEITVGPVEGLCGNEAVFGKLCETACATDSRRPYWREGVVLRLRPISLSLPASAAVKDTTAHQRNRIASAYFAREPGQPGSLLSAAGLASNVWCEPAQLYNRDEVVIGLLWREAGVVRIDAWSGRRERMDTQARGYWQGRMAMRPWNVFVAQVLQFQCQLSGLFDANNPVILPGDDCGRIREVLSHARREIDTLLARFGGSAKQLLVKADGRSSMQELKKASAEFSASYADLNGLSAQLASVDSGSGALPQQRMLINAGFFELPPAGYLPVSTRSDVQEQCRRMFGEGCKLHFHAVRSDEIAHLVEEAAHLKRISLTRGLDDPRQLEDVEVFVPDGQVGDAAGAAAGTWWHIRMVPRALISLALLSRSPGGEAKPTPVPAPRTKVKAASAQAEAAAGATEAADAIRDDSAKSMLDAALDGVIRTEARDDGSFGFALVVGSDTARNATDDYRRLVGGNAGTAADTGADAGVIAVTSRARMLIYFSADIDHAPFDLPVGGSSDFKAELATLTGTQANESGVQGQLTVLSQQALADGTLQRLVQLDVQIVEVPTGDAAARSVATRTRLLLQRDGDGGTGVFVIDDEQQDPSSSPLFFEWQDTPRRATLSTAAEAVGNVIVKRLDALRGTDTAASSNAAGVNTTGMTRDARTQLMLMSALPAMPAPASALGTAALNGLAALAEANNNAALLMRARRRLFTVLDAPRTQSVRALHDWVMFRRARTHLCGPACSPQAGAALESFQVWHLGTADVREAARLQKALDSGDATALAAFDFQRVGLLRYRDESAFSEESAEQVLQMWQPARPGSRVVLGRIWEAAPTAGQGWQNHMRLRHMLDQIASLTQPPQVGDGSLSAIAPPPGELGDKTVDGGMLVVTLGDAPQAQRRALMVYGNYDSPNHYLRKDYPHAPLDFVNNAPQGSALADFIAALNANQPVRGVTLATTKAEPDAPHAQARLASVIAALAAKGIAIPAARQQVVRLNDHDRKQLASEMGIDADDFDDIVFFELNAG